MNTSYSATGITLVALALLGLAAVLCGTHPTTARAAAPANVISTKIEARHAVADASNQFAMDLYHQLQSQSDHNLFFSPYSIEQALAIVYAGAGGKTAEQMASTLHLAAMPHDNPQYVQMGFAEINGLFPNAAESPDSEQPFKLMAANALFGQHGFSFNPPYLAMLKNDYGAPLQQVDFTKDKSAAVDKINQWAAAQTNDKIKDLLTPSAISDHTVMVLVNTIYFKANWAKQFEKDATRNAPFHVDGKEAGKDVPMMHLRHVENYAENDDCQLVELPYEGNDVAMYLVVPKKIDGLAAVEKKMSADWLSKLLLSAGSQQVELSMPRFKMTDSLNLAADLAAMGMPNAFDNSADFSGISTSQGLCINKVIHQAYVAVDEAGTEAAAATAITVRPTAIFVRRPPVVVNADRPFLFLIQHKPTGAILFLGRLENPEQ